MCVCVCVCVRACVCVCVYVYICINIHICIFMYIYVYTYPIVLGVKYFSTFNETLEHFKDVLASHLNPCVAGGICFYSKIL